MNEETLYPWINPVLLQMGPIAIRWYSLAYIFGFAAAYFLIKFFEKRTFTNNQIITQKRLDALLNITVISTLLGGRLGYVLFYNLDYYLQSPVEILQVWHGGMSFHGAMIAMFFSALIYTKIEKISFLRITDMFCLTAPIGICFGRIANFINGELWGRISDCKICIPFLTSGSYQTRHPSQLYEAVFEGFILFLRLFTAAYKKNALVVKGFISGLFLLLYGLFRFFIEFFREPDQQLGLFFNTVSMGQILCLLMVAGGMFVCICSLFKIKPFHHV